MKRRAEVKPEPHTIDVRALGRQRAMRTGRSSPTDRDWEWLGQATGGVVQGTDPTDSIEYCAGFSDVADSDSFSDPGNQFGERAE